MSHGGPVVEFPNKIKYGIIEVKIITVQQEIDEVHMPGGG